MLKERGTFKTQLRALLRASAFGEVKLLLPLISGLEELRAAKALIKEVEVELKKEGIPFSRTMPIGCMIEVPSSSMMSEILGEECDFLSIGTNDLVQYTLAVDRNNAKMSYLYTPSHLGVLRLIQRTCEGAKQSGTPVAVCGEVAADPRFALLLIGLGVKELSVSLPNVPIVKNVILNASLAQAEAIARRALQLKTVAEIDGYLTEALEDLQSN